MSRLMIAAGVVGMVFAAPAGACSLCVNSQQTPTFRQEASNTTARIIVYGTLYDPQVASTKVQIVQILRDDPWLKGRQVIEIPRFIPVSDPKNPPRYVLFCDVFQDKLDPFRGIPIKSADGLAYVQKAMKLDPKKPAENLAFFAAYLEHADPEIARDAFLELAKANDGQIAAVAPKLSAAKLRGWLKDANTPTERLSMYAFLLGACGGDEDAKYLEAVLKDRGDRANATYDGALSGYIALRPKEGWETAKQLLADGKAPLSLRLAVTRALRFHFGWQPEKARPIVLEASRIMIAQGELADVAVEDLRRWKVWDLTKEVLALSSRKGYESAIVQEAIVRYALTCNDETCKAFVKEYCRRDPETVKQVEEALRFER